MKFWIWHIIFIACVTCSYGQEPFECNGRSYRVLSADEGTYLQSIQQDDQNETVSFQNLHFYPEIEINAIAYHPTQNVIYGILQTPPYRLCRIDATFELEILQTLPLDSELIFVSGDISPDQQHLVIFGFGDTNTENIVALIDVQNGEYDTQVLTLQTSNPNQPYIYCADIAFHPTTGKLFGFDFRNGRLVTLDIGTRSIDNDTYGLSSIVVGNVPSIFFTDKGELYGIGTNLQEETENRGYYRFDLSNGQPEILQELEIERNQDACSCPFRIKLLNKIEERKNATCTDIVFELTMINRTLSDQTNLSLTTTYPEGLTIENISPFDFDGTIVEGVGGHRLNISDIYLPIGEHSFKVSLSIDENMSLGNFENQVLLNGLQLQDSELDSLLSDDPVTAVPNDATEFSIEDLDTTLDHQFFGICNGDETRIHAGIFGANSYEWSTGETTEEIIVDTEGDYEVTITTECDETVALATVSLDEINLELGDEKSIEFGETLILEPTYTSDSPILSFNWESDNNESLICPSCKYLDIQPSSDTQVNLCMENETGCNVCDRLAIKVVGIDIYAPNIFNPSLGGINSTFFLQGNLPFSIADLIIYDRWGNRMFQKKNFEANQPEDGWDGRHKGLRCSDGVYIWTATIRYKSGVLEVIGGDVTLTH